MTRQIIIDTDPGQDDAVAILLALASPELEVLAVTTVAGNVPLPLTSINARKVLELAGRREVPVYAGCDRPLVRTLVTAEYVHGRTGLDGANLPEPVTPLADGHAVDFMIETVMAARTGTITLCPLGPLTNVATAMQREPRLAGRLQAIVLMGGGCFEGGNVTPAAEFNIYVDPQAADVVLRSGADITMLPLDVTHQALIEQAHLDRIRDLGTPVGEAVFGLLEFFERHDLEKYGSAGGPLHDPTVIGYLLRPDLFSGRMCSVIVETESELTMGMTVTDWWGVTDREPNVLFIRHLDTGSFFDILIDRLGRL